MEYYSDIKRNEILTLAATRMNLFKKIYLFCFLTVVDLCCYMWAFSNCSKRGLLFILLYGLFVAVASLVENRLWSSGSVVVADRLSCFAACGVFLDHGLNRCPTHCKVDS